MSKKDLSSLLLNWYNKNGRTLPWRIKGGAHPNPYIILVSEFMLQQTTVKTVIPYFTRFINRFPTINDLATASIEEIYLYWQGLGYYTRAKSLHQTAQIITDKYHGTYPQTRKEILALKGIGEYTTSSFLALAFNLPETVIDGNVTRIICRLYNFKSPINEIKEQIKEKAEDLTDKNHAADYASAIMDLGAMICTPKNPKCEHCPWQKYCQSAQDPDLEKIPYKTAPSKIQKKGNVYLIFDNKERILIHKRTEKGLLSGLYEFPWSEDKLFPQHLCQDTNKEISHIFTHIKLTLHLFTIHSDIKPTNGIFVQPEELEKYPFSTLMKKVWQTYLKK